MKIRVPATSANLGPGFDSCGIALSKYLFIEIMEEVTDGRSYMNLAVKSLMMKVICCYVSR